MIKVLIADDEAHICRLIQVLINWEELEMELVGFASNGLEALEILKREKADILITDIRMPGCGGLELIEWARRMSPNLQIVVISGYANFEYAQSAMHFGVKDYLLKPINKEELSETMLKLKDKIKEDYQENMRREDSVLNREKDERKLRQVLIQRLLDVQTQPVDMNTLNEQYHFSAKEGLYLGFCLRTDTTMQSRPEDMMELYRDRMVQTFDIVLAKCCYAWSFYQHHFSIYGILNCDKNETGNVKHALKDGVNQMNTQKHLFGDVVFTLGMGDFVSEPQQLQASLLHSKEAVKERLIDGAGKLIEYCEHQPVLYEMRVMEAYSRSIAHAVHMLDVEELAKANETLRDAVLNARNVRGSEIYETALEAGNIFMLHMNPENKEILREEFHRKCDSCSQAEELFHAILNVQKEYLESLIHIRQQEQERPIRIAKQYIAKHFAEPISLEDVSQLAGFSPAYFSVLFKKETGQGFAKYLMSVRMEEATNLLRETNYSIAEICKRVGYNDLKYFTQSFEKIAGVKPSVFRKLYG